MRKSILAVLAYVAATFVTQAGSHFIVNRDHYASVSYLRQEPIFPLGILSMFIQAAVLAYLYPRVAATRRTLGSALVFAWLTGGILVSYIALGEAAKYQVPSVPSWITVEALAGGVQFTLFGLLLGMIHRQSAVTKT
jgi:hypothetical protein